MDVITSSICCRDNKKLYTYNNNFTNWCEIEQVQTIKSSLIAIWLKNIMAVMQVIYLRILGSTYITTGVRHEYTSDIILFVHMDILELICQLIWFHFRFVKKVYLLAVLSMVWTEGPMANHFLVHFVSFLWAMYSCIMSTLIVIYTDITLAYCHIYLVCLKKITVHPCVEYMSIKPFLCSMLLNWKGKLSFR